MSPWLVVSIWAAGIVAVTWLLRLLFLPFPRCRWCDGNGCQFCEGTGERPVLGARMIRRGQHR